MTIWDIQDKIASHIDDIQTRIAKRRLAAKISSKKGFNELTLEKCSQKFHATV
jgi:hypothetical protein